jgi:hypothetical protein
MLKAGAAQVNITPPVGCELVGQWVARKSTGVNDELFANALVLDNGSVKFAMVSCDVLSIGNTTRDRIRALIAQETDLNPNHVLLHGTHTHTGPAVISALGTDADEAYRDWFVKAVAGAVKIANDRRQDALIGIGSGSAPGWAFPRRYWMKGGYVQMHPRKGDPNIVRVQGTADPQVNVLYVTTPNEQPIAVVVNFACHSTVVGGEHVISADFPGAIRDVIKKVKGTQTVVLFANGACGDVCQIDVENPNHHEHGHRWREKMGLALASEALKVIAAMDVNGAASSAIKIKQEILPLPIRDIPADRLAQAKAAFANRPMHPPPRTRDEIVQRELILLSQDKERDANVYAELMAIRIDQAAIITIPGEFFCDLGKRIKAEGGFETTFVVELANGCVGYLPTLEAFDGGGYETELVRSSKLIPEAGNMVVEKAIALLAEVRRDA